MVKCKYWKLVLTTVLFKIFLGISASTHWVVTENGKIQSQLDSVFHMRRPYDLLSLLEQEQRASQIDRLYRDMIERKASIDEEWAGLESATELETRLYTTDPNCLQAGKPLSDVDLYTSVAEDGTSREDIDLQELLPSDTPFESPNEPDCSSAINLEFSMRNFPHLQALSWNLTIAPEVFENVRSLSEQTARQIAAGLSRNRTSWFLHNLAALYWRSQGDAQRALQCAKRAVFLSPRHHRDLALLNLGCIVQQARCPAEAAIVLHAAIDHAPNVAASHLALANVYAILGDYNRSIACYNNVLKLRKHWPIAERNRFAVLCHQKLENSLYQLHSSLQGIVGQLHDYHSLHEQWLKHQEELMYQQAPLEVKLQQLAHEPLAAVLSHKGENCVPQIQDGNTVFTCDSKLLAHHLQRDITLSLQMLLKNVETQAQKISEQMSRRLMSSSEPESPLQVGEQLADSPHDPDIDSDDSDGGLEIFVEPSEEEPQVKVETEEDKVDTAPSDYSSQGRPKPAFFKGSDLGNSVLRYIEKWMKSQQLDEKMLIPFQQCKSSDFTTDGCSEELNHWVLPSAVEDETRQLKMLPLAQSLGIVEEGSWLQNTSSHVIATLIITCIQLSQWDSSQITSKQEQPECSSVASPVAELTPDSFRNISPEPRLKAVFPSQLFGDDISSHLSYALKDSSSHEPSTAWVLNTAAAIYWRFVGNTQEMVSCLQAAVESAPSDFKDIPLHHLARILLSLGYRQEALLLASLALKVAPRSINAHMVLFHTYLAMGEPENAMKYEKATLALHRQSQAGPP